MPIYLYIAFWANFKRQSVLCISRGELRLMLTSYRKYWLCVRVSVSAAVCACVRGYVNKLRHRPSVYRTHSIYNHVCCSYDTTIDTCKPHRRVAHIPFVRYMST